MEFRRVLFRSNTLTLSVFEDNQGSVDGQTTQGVSAGPLELPVFFTAEPQDNDDSESITKVTLALEGAPEGAAFVSGGEAIEEGDVIAGGTASFVDGKLVLTFEPGVASVNLDAIRVKLPQHSDNDFSIKIVPNTTEADNEGDRKSTPQKPN